MHFNELKLVVTPLQADGRAWAASCTAIDNAAKPSEH